MLFRPFWCLLSMAFPFFRRYPGLMEELFTEAPAEVPQNSWEGFEYSEHPFVSRPWGENARALLGSDLDCPENAAFSYGMVRPAAMADRPSGRLVILLHGLNERSWAKYLPWARSLASDMNAAVLLFPLAFHMQRSPRICGERERVFSLYRGRRALLGPSGCSSHANAVLSARLQERPLRFFSSGLQSYRDVTDIAAQVKRGVQPMVAADARIDFFGYSIGVFLGQMLLMADPSGLFSKSRLFGFCGGSTMDRANALSRAILDAGATQALDAFFRDPGEGGAALAGPSEWERFLSMLDSAKMTESRSSWLEGLGDRISCAALRRDEVFPLDGIREILGERVKSLDFPYDYSHVSPFPSSCADKAAVEGAREAVMGMAAEFLDRAS